MKKILFFLPNFNGGGAEKVTVNIIKSLNESNKFHIHLVVLEKTGAYLEQLPQNIIVHDLKSKKTMFSILKLRYKILEIQPDIVFSTLIRTHIALYLALKLIQFKAKIILRSPNSPKLLLENNQLNFLMKLLVENTYKKADIVIAQTDEMKNELSELHGLDLKKIVVLMNPIDKYTINQSIQNIKNPFDKEFVNVVAAGRIIEQKGFDILIQAFKKVLKQNASFRLYIIGEDVVGQKQILLDYINSNNLQENIFFLGFQNNPYKFFYFSDLYVLSSRWEGLPNTVLENLYLKKPIVATNCIKTMESLIENGKNGLIVDVENVDDLADAILSYKTIDVSYQTIHFDSSDLINIFSIGDN